MKAALRGDCTGIGQLAAIAGTRTALNSFLERELERGAAVA